MHHRFTDKVVIVTGSSSGIGKATALQFASEGAKVCVVANRNVEGGEATVAEIIQHEGDAFFIQADVGKTDDCARVVDLTIEKYGKVDVLVNNAGITRGAPFEQMEEELWDRLFDTNLKSCFLLSKKVLPSMLEAGKGAIVHIGSVHGIATVKGHAAYAATKAGMCGLTRGMGVEFGARGIRTNCVVPGTIDLGIFRIPEDERETWQPHPSDIQVMKRLGGPYEISAAICFLASDEASFINGECLVADGGLTTILRDRF